MKTTSTEQNAASTRPTRKSLRGGTATPNQTHVSHVTPRPLLDPIREVKRESLHIKRKLFHVAGVSAAWVTYAFTSVTPLEACLCLGLFAAFFVTADIARFFIPSLNKKVKKDLGALMRDYELDGLSGSSWFLIAGIITIALFPKWPAVLGMAYLAFGDPIASFVGVKYGRIKIPGNKSLEGTLALFGFCTLLGSAVLLGLTEIPAATAVGLAAATALVAAFAEWLPLKRIDDNMRMPIITAAIGTLLFAAVGI